MVLEGIASSILSHFLSKYIYKLNTKDIKMSIFSGKVELDNLSIKETALMEHRIPFRVEKGTVRKISASIPYTKLKTAPCVASIDEIYVLGTLAGRVLIQADSDTNNTKEISDEYGTLDEALQNENISKLDFTTGVIGSIIDNIRVTVSNVHIRLEYESGKRMVAVGVVIPMIKVSTIDDTGKEVDVNLSKTKIKKKLILSNLSVYLDTNSKKITDGVRNNTIDFREEMKKLQQSNDHQFILHNCSLEVIYEHFKEGNGPIQFGNIVNVSTVPINLAFDMLQYRCFNQLNNENIKFNRKRFYASCGRPNEYPEEDKNNECFMWWQFLNRSSYQKNNPINFNPQKALIFLKNRQKQLSTLSQILTNPNPKKDEKYLQKLQEKYGGDVFLMFRAYAKMITEKQLREEQKKKSNKDKLEIQSKELQEIISQKDFIKNNSDTLAVQFKLEEINVSLSFNDKKPLLLLKWENWRGLIEKNKSDIAVDAHVGNLLLINKKADNLPNIITMNQSKATQGNSVLLSMNGNLDKKLFNVQISLASPQFYLDMPIIYDIAHFFKSTSDIAHEEKAPKIKKRDMTDLEISSHFDEHVTLLLNVHLETPIAKIPYKQPITVSIGNIDIKSINANRKMTMQDVDSWYNKYSIDITGFNAYMDDKMICQPINFNLGLDQTFIRKNSVPMLKFSSKISDIAFDLNREQYCLLLQFPEFLHNEAFNATPIDDITIEKDDSNHQIEKINNNNQSFNLDDLDLSFLFNILLDQVSLNLINFENKKCCDAKIRGIKCGIKAIQSTIISNFNLQNLLIQSNNHEIVSFGDSKEDAIKANLLMKGIDINTTLQTARPIITVDIDWIMELFNFFNPPQELFKYRDSKIQSDISVIGSYFNSVAFSILNPKKELNEYQITRLLKTHPNIKIDINCTAPKIILPIRNSAFIANLGLIHIYTKDPIKRELSNTDSYYDRFMIELNNFEILGDDNEHLLNPFSTSIEVDKSFISLKSIKQIKTFVNIHDFDLEIKQRNFQSLITVVDQFISLYFSMTDKISTDSLETITSYESIDAKKTSSTHLYDFEHIFLNSENILSILVDLKFQNLRISLLKEDRSVHSSFVMNQLQTAIDISNKNIDANFKIVKLNASSENEVLVSFGKENIDSFNCQLSIINEKITVDFTVSEPTINLNFDKIFQLIKFIEIPLQSLIFLIDAIGDKNNNQKLKKKSINNLTQQNLSIEDSSTNSIQPKNKLKVTGKFNKIKVKSPVLYEKLNEILEIEINCDLEVTEAIKINVNSLIARFNDQNGYPHPPFIPKLSLDFALQSNVVVISTNPIESLITVALDDIASIGVFVNSLLKFIDSLKSTPINENKEKTVDINVDIDQFSISAEINKLQIQLNNDRFQTIPLFRFCLRQLNFIYTVDTLSRSCCQFDSIDFMDIDDFNWKMLVEPFSADVELLHKTTNVDDLNELQLNVSISDPMNINFAYSAVQMILKYSKLVSKMMSSKVDLNDKPPSFRVQNISSETIIIKNKDSKLLCRINPNCSHDLNITKDDEIDITIGEVSKKIITSKLHYPIFITNKSVLSHSMSEKGTTLLVSSVLLFDNQTEFPLYLLKQVGLRRYSNVMDISSHEKKPMITLNELKTAQFALTTEKSLLNASHETFTLKTVKKSAILLECVFPNKTKIKLIVSCIFDPLSCSINVKIEPTCMIQNQLPVELIIKLTDNSLIRIKEGEKIKTTFIDTNKSEFSAYFSAGHFSFDQQTVFSGKCDVSIKDGTFSPIELTFIPDSLQSPHVVQITVKAMKNPNKPQINLIFYAPALIYNRSGFNLGCAYLDDGKINRISRFSPREKDCDPFKDGFAFWSSKEFYMKGDKKRLPLVLFVTDLEKTYVDDDEIECSVSHIDGPIMIPTSNPKLYFPLHFTITSAEPYSASQLVTITSQCRITNLTSKSFYIQPIITEQEEENNENNNENNQNNDKNDQKEKWTFGDLVEIKSGTMMEKIEIASLSLLFAFRPEADSKNYSILNFSEPIHTTFAIDDKIFEIEAQELKVEMVITIKEAIFPQPLNLLNDLENDDEIYITQASSTQSIDKEKIWKSTAQPQTMTVIAYDMPFGGTDLILHYKDEEIPVNLIAVNSPCEYRNIYYEVITNKNNTKTIVVSSKLWRLVEPKNKLDFHFNISKINFVIIDKFDHEFCLLRLQDLSFSYSTGEFNSVQFKMRNLQLDDLQPSSVLKVVAAGYPEDEKDKDGNTNYFIDFSISMFPNAPFLTACQDISLKVEPIVVFLDTSFLADSISLLQTFFVIENKESYLLSKPKPSEPSSLNSIPLTAKSFTINEINITLFVRSTSSRPILYKSTFSFLKAIPDITNGQIDLPSFHFEDCTMNAAYIEKEIVKPIINAGIAQGIKLLFNTDIFMRSTGTRSASFARKGERLMNGELQVLIQVPGSIVLQGGETFTNFFSKVAHMTAFDNKSSINRVNTTAKDTMVSGMKALGNGFKDGLSGIVTQPMKMGEESGIGGAIVGFGKGMIGLVAKPVAGFLDAGVASFAAVRKKINGEDDDVIPPIRCARALPMIQQKYFTENMMKIKDFAQLNFQMSDIEFLYNQWVEMYVIDPDGKVLVGVTQNYLFISDDKGTITYSFKIKKIVDIQFESKDSTVKVIVYQSLRNKEIIIKVKNSYLGFRITQLINSRRIPLGIGE